MSFDLELANRRALVTACPNVSFIECRMAPWGQIRL